MLFFVLSAKGFIPRKRTSSEASSSRFADYRRIELSDVELKLIIDHLRTEWNATERLVERPLARSIEAPPRKPPRTVCSDFEFEPFLGPLRVKKSVTTWSEVVRQCEADIELKRTSRWWTIAAHGDEVTDFEDAGLVPTSTIQDNAYIMFPPALTPSAIDDALRTLQRVGMPPEINRSEQISSRLAGSQWEKAALAKFLLLCQLHLRKGDTLQLFVCHLDGTSSPVETPIPLVKRLSALLPGVRIVVYVGVIQWQGKDGRHRGNSGSIYCRDPQ